MQLDLHSIPICCGKYETGETALEAHSEEVASEARCKERDGAILANSYSNSIASKKDSKRQSLEAGIDFDMIEDPKAAQSAWSTTNKGEALGR